MNTMLQFRMVLVMVVVGLGFVGCSQHPSVEPPLDPRERLVSNLDVLFSDPAFYNAHWGVAIQSLETGEVFYRRNENKGFMPASNMKLYTTTAALLQLGPDFRLKTELILNGTVDDQGVLHGDLIIKGGADPSLSGRYYDGDVLYVMKSWIDSLSAKGIRSIDGRIIGDDNYLDDEIMGLGWQWDDISDYYSAQISGLTFNDNCVDLYFKAGDTLGDTASMTLVPNTQYLDIENKVITTDMAYDAGISLKRKSGTNQVECRGSFLHSRQQKTESVTVENPTLYTAFVFGELLSEHGIDHGKAYDLDDLDDYIYTPSVENRLATHQSPKLLELITTVNKVSQNLFAELFLRILGKEILGQGNAAAGEKAAEQAFALMGIQPQDVEMADGSGLSRKNMITPASMVKLLKYMHHHPYGEMFYNTLPIAGVDGTISKRMRGTAAANNVHAKTGYISRARALSGYVTSRDGEEFVFSMIANNYTVPTSMANHLQDTVCELLASFSR